MPEAENAATGSRAPAPSSTPTPQMREPRLRPSPPTHQARPPPPVAARNYDGNMVERLKPLRRCPDLACVRGRRCRAEAAADYCHRFYQTQEDYRIGLLKRLQAAARGLPKHVHASKQDEEESMAQLYKALRARMGYD